MTGRIRTAIYDLLSGDGELLAMLAHGENSIYYQEADKDSDEGVEMPIVIFQKASGTPQWTFRDSIDWANWIIKAVGEVEASERIADRLRELCDDAVLVIQDAQSMYLRRWSDVDLPEVLNGERVEHTGYIWRLATEEA